MGQQELSLVTSTVFIGERWSHMTGWQPLLDPPVLVLLWANDLTPVSWLLHWSNGDTISRAGALSAPTPQCKGSRGQENMDGSPVQQPLPQLLQDPLVKVSDGWEFAQAAPQLLPGQRVLALLVYFIQGPYDSSVEILKPQRPVTHS